MIHINYENLLSKYNDQLTNKLRGFNTDEDYLQFWVPNDEIITSLLNLIDSLKESHNLQFKIEINKKRFNKASLEKFKNILSEISAYNFTDKKDINAFSIKINPKKIDTYFLNNSKTEKSLKVNKHVQLNKINEIYEKEIIAKDYFDVLFSIKIEKDKLNRQSLNTKNRLNYINKSSLGTFTLYFSKDLKDIQLSFKINDNFIKQKIWIDKLIYKLNNIMIDMNLQEVKDHSLIYLLDSLNNNLHNKKRIGIRHVENAGKIFYELKNFFILAYKKLNKENIVEINKSYPEISKKWLIKSDKEKNDSIIKVINDFSIINKLEDASIIFNEIKDSFKVRVDYSDSFLKYQKKQNYLISLEQFLKEKIDFRIEVFTNTKIDDNKLRIKNLK